jgi:hypothetical protein
MAFTKIEITSSEWTLIGNNVTDMTFQNVSQWPFYINFNSSNVAPSEEVGLVYGPWQGELKKDVTDLTYKASPNYVFAKAISKPTKVIVETV